MKVRFGLFFFAVLGCIGSLCDGPVSAQGMNLPPPPAYAVAQRLQSEAYAALAAADRYRASGDKPNTDFQVTIARRRAIQATRKYNEVVASRMYGHTPFAPEGLFQSAQLQDKVEHDVFGASTTLQKLHNDFPPPATYPSSTLAESYLTSIEARADNFNKTGRFAFLYATMDFLVKLCGGKSNPYSYFLAILLISVVIRIILTPLSNQQYKSMKEMQKLQPYIKEIQAKYKNDKEAQGRKTMELYKEHGINPAAGCAPMVLQFPILIGLYTAIRIYQYQFANGKFIWIGSGLSHHFPNILAVNLGQQDIPLLLLYALSMYVTSKMTVTPSMDPAQAEQQKATAAMMPFFLTFMFLQYHLPSAFILYYLIFNILSTTQQYYYMKRRAGPGNDDNDKKPPFLPFLPSAGSSKALPDSSPRNGNGTHGALSNDSAPLSKATLDGGSGDKFSRPTSRNGSGAIPVAKGVIAPKVHPKKKRR